MGGQVKVWTLLTLLAGLLCGSAVRAQGITQSTNVTYAVTLVDADPARKLVNGALAPVSADTTSVRVQVTVSVPRTEGNNRYTIPAIAKPAGLMFRAHDGKEGTAWAHSIGLVRDAPYAPGGTPRDAAFYPMPQKAEAPNLSAVLSGSATNLAGEAYAGYLRNGRAHDPARWEATYLSAASYDVAEGANALVASLLQGQATHEWYAASEYGLGSFARISPIQDHGRAMDFTDLRLWQGARRHPWDPASGTGISIDTSSQATLGAYDTYWLRAMPGGEGPGVLGAKDGWRIVRGAIGCNYAGEAGAQLFNVAGENEQRVNGAAIESPVYPDGIASISFMARASLVDEAQDGSTQRLELWYQEGGMALETKLATFDLTTGMRTYTYTFGKNAEGRPLAAAGSNVRFALRRATVNNGVGSGAQNIASIVVRNLRVRSAAPTATFGEAQVANTASAIFRPWAGEPFTVSFQATPNDNTASLPRGYAATLRLRRRAEGDGSALWRTTPLSVIGLNDQGAATLRASFTPGTLITNIGDGTVNAAEGAFFTNAANGNVTGVMPGVYDMALSYNVYGSFLAGRDQMDAREAVTGTQMGTVINLDSGRDAIDPYLLDVRERRTQRRTVSLRVMYKGRADDGEGSAIRTVDVPCLPSSTEAGVWRVALPKSLRLSDYGLPDDEAAEYAWGYLNDADEPVFSVGYLPFTVVARVPGDDEEQVYGQDGASAPGVLPPTSEIVPAITQRLAGPTAADAAVPVVVPMDGLKTSHVLAEVDFSGDAPEVRLCGAFWQDFNTWFASNGFGATEFRENVTAVTAAFNCTTTTNESGNVIVDRGWIPDEGPLAQSTSFTETFEMTREKRNAADSGLPFALPNETYQGTEHFVMWGAAPEVAEPYLLRPDRDKGIDTSLYMTFGNGTELVVNRAHKRNASGRTYLPDAQVRLREGRGSLTPRSDANGITLNGVGTVSFKLGLSLPYDINGIAQFRGKDGSLLGDKWGISSGIAFDSGSTALNATSGYSVSYYLVNDRDGKKYELRLTQKLAFDDRNAGSDGEAAPEGQVVAELYEWTRGQEYPSRLTIADASGTGIAAGYVVAGTTLSSMRAALWVRADGTLGAGWVAGNITATPGLQIRSSNVCVAPSGAPQLTPALGSAECRPVFRAISFATAANNNYINGLYPTMDTVYVYTAESSTIAWSLTTDAEGASRVQLRRATPSKDKAGRVVVRATGDNKEKTLSTTLSGEVFTVTLGSAKGRLTIVPVGRDSVFLDDITVTSWCGNDNNRNGETRVPRNTDTGFYQSDGFAGVGIWVRPEEDAQLGVSPAEYSGRQCVLLQRSRRNTSYTSDETTEGGTDGAAIRHTGSTLALYSPWSDTGFGTVSFRYRIPQLDEYGSGRENPPVSLMLQYKDSATAHLSWLGDNPGTGWRNVTPPFALENTAGEWRSMSITPKLDGNELTGRMGNLRLVMVTTGLSGTDDPYVYLDDLTFTDNQGTSASWSATNVKLTDSPVSLLYWKDRAATEGAVPEEGDFAHKSSLTRALQFNNVQTDGETDGTYGLACLTSPVLSDGVGRVTFAARRTDAAPEPARVYVEFATELNEDEEALRWETLTYVDVTNTVYRAVDIDLAKFRKTLTPLDPDTLLPGEPMIDKGAKTFDSSAVRRLRLRTRLENDNEGNDPFGEAPRLGRVLLDTLTIANPVTASLRVRTVMFSNLAGTGTVGFERQLERLNAGKGMSPLAQPVSGTSALRALVVLDRMQQVRSGSVRVFLTYDLNSPGAGMLSRETLGYTYADVLGNTVSGSSTAPVYTWKPGEEARWPLSAWFDQDAAYAAVAAGGLPANTVELTAVASGVGGEASFFVGDLSKSGIPDLSPNALVRYVAWAVYESAEDEASDDARKFVARQEASSYTEFPWYFPRSLNVELRARVNAAADASGHVGSSFFSPYFWVYSCLPGEVFLNEFNLADNGSAMALRPFVEFCAPVNLDLGGWGVVLADRSGSLDRDTFFRVPVAADGVRLPAPDNGVVPTKRMAETSANRSFYTALGFSGLYHRAGGTEVELADTVTNAGIAASGYEGYRTGSNTTAGALLLLRPTGGAEHVVVFSNVNEANLSESAKVVAQANIDALHGLYRSAYITAGFGGEWTQDFLEENWGDVVDADPSLPDAVTAEEHARRLTKADVFAADPNTGDYLPAKGGTAAFAQDYAKTPFANSIATVDMGGKWVTRKNHVNEKADGGPTDLTHLTQWNNAFNPTEQARASGKDVQVTPRQVNPDQYLFRYTGLNQNTIASIITGLGTHELSYKEGTEESATERTRQAGREPQVTWSVSATVAEVSLTYTPLLFHRLGAVTLRVMDAKEGLQVTDEAKLRAALAGMSGYTIAADGTVTFTPDDSEAAEAYTITVKLQGAAEDERYNLEFATAFSLDASKAKDVLTSVKPYCGDAFPGSAKWQPWWGSSFGFTVDYEDSTETGGSFLSSVLVTYPSPVAPDYQGGAADALGKGLSGSWSGTRLEVADPVSGDSAVYALDGMEYAAATNLLTTVFAREAGTRFVELKGATGGHVADPSVIGILSDAYAKAAGYNAADASTYAKKEPAIPFCVWGVYTVSVVSDTGSTKVSFLVRQPTLAEKPGLFGKPHWYEPLANLNDGRPAEGSAPYFYLYSTPSQSAWLNELNLVKAADVGDTAGNTEPYAEVVMPILRAGITNAVPKVEQTDPRGWGIRRYGADGAALGSVSLATATAAPSASYSYNYNTIPLATETLGQVAYVLHRPCGAAEGGVWTGVSPTGGNVVPAPGTLAQNAWLLPAADMPADAPVPGSGSYVVAGVTDASASAAGSVQLTGPLVWVDDSFQVVSSDVTQRTEWRFLGETRDADNEGVRPDTKPIWNQVTLTSALRNTVYGGTSCGYHVFGFLPDDSFTGASGIDVTLSETLGGPDWVFSADKRKVFTYRPRANYRFESLQVPKDLIGKIMLVGKSNGMTEEEVVAEVARLRALADNATSPEEARRIRTEEWIRLCSRPDVAGNVRAVAETTTEFDEAGNPVTAFTGLIRFNPNFIQGTEEGDTFGNDASFTLTVVFAEEPASAQNAMVMSFGQGEIRAGAWLFTQTLFALADDGTPDAAKGGVAVEKPIWSDETGNAEGAYANLHGWLHQPTVGDHLGMAAVISPEDGLRGGNLADPYGMLVSGALRPYLVWTLIPKANVPTNLFTGDPSGQTRSRFLRGWDLPQWLTNGTALPTVGDRNPYTFALMRRNLQNSVNTEGSLFSAAGIIPMVYTEKHTCPDDALSEGIPTKGALHFRTVTAEELADPASLLLPEAANGELSYSSAIDTSDAALWQDGAVARFAIILVTQDGQVHDVQSISNFASETQPAYCPWYLPDATSNINAVTRREEAGVSPYFWVYAIGQGDVWINEFRPYDIGTGAPSALELAMKADTGIVKDELGRWIPSKTLDGWKIAVKAAPMPTPLTPETERLRWISSEDGTGPLEGHTVNLKGWIPFRRIRTFNPEDSEANPNNAYDLDFYTVATSATQGILEGDNSLPNHPYDASDPDTGKTFQWLKAEKPLLPAGIGATLQEGRDGSAYLYGVVYAVQLIRSNGAVADEVLFYSTPLFTSSWDIKERIRQAVRMEAVSGLCAGTVRAVEFQPLPEQPTANTDTATAQFVEWTTVTPENEAYRYHWRVFGDDGSRMYTLPAANDIRGYLGYDYAQPYADYVLPSQRMAALTARLVGGDARLTLRGALAEQSGTNVGGLYARGSGYELTVLNQAPDWFTLVGVRKNGTEVAPPPARRAAVYALSASGALRAEQEQTLDIGTLTADTDYAVVFAYTPDAARLDATGALESEDADFLRWLREVAPDAILSQSAADGVTASEKYWLGFDNAAFDASEVALTIRAIGTQAEPAAEGRPAETLPTLSFRLAKGETPVGDLRGDGVVVLLGKTALGDPWRFVRELHPADLTGESTLVIPTDCRFFRAILLSRKKAQALNRGE